ncbi:MAG: hypothetical protein C5S43_00370 [Candidatus Methanocomedens sp.]|nr:MAG: hypothetical protein C5S43_00370 [ANME-2 cluster archaeon]
MTDTPNEDAKDYLEVKMAAGWYMTITLATSERFEKDYVEIAKERAGQKRSRFNLNPKYTRELGEALLKFADANKL